MKAATWNPAHELGMLDEIGSIRDGKLADFVICDSQMNRQQVYIGGQLL